MDSSNVGSVLSFREELGVFLETYQKSFDTRVDDSFIQGWILADIVRSSENFLNNLYMLSSEEVELALFPVFPETSWLADDETPEVVQNYLSEYIDALNRFTRIISEDIEVSDESISDALEKFTSS